VALMLKDEPKLLENIDRVTRVLELLSDKEFKNRNDVNEILSLKYHILHYIVKVSSPSSKAENLFGDGIYLDMSSTDFAFVLWFLIFT
jgi:hypothetical protein